MGFSYYVFEKDGNRHELDPKGLGLLTLLQSSKEGEIFINRPSDQNTIQYKIKYNVNNADVDVIDADSPPGVTAFYNDQSAIEMRKPIYDSITVLAEIDLLNKLYALKDEKICAIIAQNHFDPNNNNEEVCVRNTTLKSIDATLASILAIKYSNNNRSIFQSSPEIEKGRIIQTVLKEAQQEYLSTKESDRVLSLKQVADLINKINQNISKSISQEKATISSP